MTATRNTILAIGLTLLTLAAGNSTAGSRWLRRRLRSVVRGGLRRRGLPWRRRFVPRILPPRLLPRSELPLCRQPRLLRARSAAGQVRSVILRFESTLRGLHLEARRQRDLSPSRESVERHAAQRSDERRGLCKLGRHGVSLPGRAATGVRRNRLRRLWPGVELLSASTAGRPREDFANSDFPNGFASLNVDSIVNGYPVTDAHVDFASMLHSSEINIRQRLFGQLDFVTGFRWVEMFDRYEASGTSFITGNTLSQRIETRNHIFGWQTGLDGRLFPSDGPFQLGAFIKAGEALNNATSSISLSDPAPSGTCRPPTYSATWPLSAKRA